MIIGALNRSEYLAHRHARAIGAAAVWFALTIFIGPTWAAILTYLGGWLFARPAMFRLHVRYAWVLAAAIIVLAVHSLLVGMVGPRWGMAGTFWTFGFTAFVNRVWLRKQWAEFMHWRQWRIACQRRGLYHPGGTTQHPYEQPVPHLLSAKTSPVGLRLRVACGAWTAEQIEQKAAGLATEYRARQVTVIPDERNANLCTVLIHTRDPLARLDRVQWPNLGSAQLSMWQPIPLGLNENGEPVTAHLPEAHLLLAGLSGSGKSVAQSLLLATAALDPNTALFVLDGKEVDLPMWQPACDGFAGASVPDALRVLDQAHAWLDAARPRITGQRGKRKIAPGDPLCVVLVDELAYYASDAGTKDQRAQFVSKLGDLVRRGRALGVIVIAATQRPASDLIPTTLRDNIPWRWSLRAATPASSDMTLGQGMAARGYDASTIPEGQKGTGLLLHEDGVPVKLRSYFLDDAEVVLLAERAANLRQAVGSRGQVVHAARPAGVECGDSAGFARSAGVPGDSAAPHSAGPGSRDTHASADAPVGAAVVRWREPVFRALEADAGRSNRAIGREVGCDPKTVARYRAEWDSSAAGG